MLAGALEGLEATLALLMPKASEHGSRMPMRGRRLGALQRRAGELRNDLRFLMRAADTDFVYYLEVARPRHVSARLAHRRLAHRPRGVVRSDAHDGPDVGDARGRRIVRVREGQTRYP